MPVGRPSSLAVYVSAVYVSDLDSKFVNLV